MATKASKKASENDYQRIFDLQNKNQYNIGNTGAGERKAKIRALKEAVEVEYREKIREASRLDLGKSVAEADLTEVFPIVSEAKHAIRHLKSWIKPQKVSTPLSLLGATSWIKYEPKGVCLIISPWNFPLI